MNFEWGRIKRINIRHFNVKLYFCAVACSNPNVYFAADRRASGLSLAVRERSVGLCQKRGYRQ